ncbi:hypothetical protein [Methanobrevibacter millerae]|uniref:Uncharacterized protein n=1 Tax=Methanobrevibacter millerae TaxID=230361 RepID=A0A1G5VRX7_9EURY|nr:hypothetical protein [Methanobrevibacter millerae]SDA48498.1 hypothetical protein SAMN02910315_00818 [Methanobrevibacter millerae]
MDSKDLLIMLISDDDYKELTDLIVEVRTQLLDDNLIDKWLEINS